MKRTFTLFILIFTLTASVLQAQVNFSTYEKDGTAVFVLQNKMVRQSVVIKDKMLLSDTLQSL